MSDLYGAGYGGPPIEQPAAPEADVAALRETLVDAVQHYAAVWAKRSTTHKEGWEAFEAMNVATDALIAAAERRGRASMPCYFARGHSRTCVEAKLPIDRSCPACKEREVQG